MNTSTIVCGVWIGHLAGTLVEFDFNNNQYRNLDNSFDGKGKESSWTSFTIECIKQHTIYIHQSNKWMLRGVINNNIIVGGYVSGHKFRGTIYLSKIY